MEPETLYTEKVSSKWTQALFVMLTLLFLLLAVWRTFARGRFTGWAIAFACFSAMFLFYAINFRTLIIRIAKTGVHLTFGIFHWKVPFDNIEFCALDNAIPWGLKYGGAGVHFMSVRKRYRVSFNVLEYERVVIGLRQKAGLVRDVSFSTRHPTEILRVVNERLTE
ncbi:MAG: hypothetical protein V2J07_02710 [Anaerolineae bacterium]|jgi:hypothetical protein|nr:hypothetical protein [Anaerolineae bacterium]